MNKFAKAITAGVVSGLSSLATAAIDNSIVLGEGMTAAAAAAAAFGLVYGIRNGEG